MVRFLHSRFTFIAWCAVLLTFGCGKRRQAMDEHSAPQETRQKVVQLATDTHPPLSASNLIPDVFHGDWYLIVYAGREDWTFEMGNLEEIHIGEVRIGGAGLKEHRGGYILTHGGAYNDRVWRGWCGSEFIVMRYRNENQVFLDVTDANNKTIWRGCYLSTNIVNQLGIQNKSMMALAALTACQEYWADFGPTAKEKKSKQ